MSQSGTSSHQAVGCNVDRYLNDQHQSSLLAAPTEIRNEILAHLLPPCLHLLANRKALSLAECVQREDDDHPACCAQGVDYGMRNYGSNPIQIRRLQSVWGTHWRCEEDILHNRCAGSVESLLLVCKRMLIDVIDLIADTTTIHINDINTLEKLTSDFHSRETRSSLITKFLIPRIKELHINLKIPIAAFSAIESACEASVLYPIQSSAWTNFPRLTTHMSRLCKLNIWLDHNEFCSWSVVNERAALSYLEAIQRPNINISINLPKLHPKWESAQRHFLRDDVRTPMRIHRRNRQRVHGIVHSDGRMETLWAPDFPVALELMYFDHGKTEEDRQANIEALERDWWKDGLDPVAEMRSLLADFQK